MKNYTLLIIVVFLCITSCKKEDNGNLYYSDTLISQINSENLAIQGFTYNSNYLIYESMEPYLYKRYSYDAHNALSKVEMVNSFSALSCVAYPGQPAVGQDPRKAAITQYSEFEYDNALRLTKKSNYFINSGNPELTSYQTFNYENNRIVKTSTFNPQGESIDYHEYKYDERGNVTRDDRYTNNSGMKLTRTMVYEFDDRNNPYQVLTCEGNPGKYTNKNNIIKTTTISYNGTAESRSTSLSVYEYNNLDYPVKINGWVCLYGK
jgi:hypothetical protein